MIKSESYLLLLTSNPQKFFQRVLSYCDRGLKGQDCMYLVAQSICTLISNWSGPPDIFLGSWTLKKYRPSKSAPIFLVYQVGLIFFRVCNFKKRFKIFKKQPGLFSFWITMTLCFCTLLFATHILDLFLQGHKPTHVFKTRIVGTDWLGDLAKLWVLQWPYNALILFTRFHVRYCIRNIFLHRWTG